MTRQRQMQASVLPFLILILLLLLGSCGCLALRGKHCMFDTVRQEFMDNVRESVVYELPKPDGRPWGLRVNHLDDNNWSPIRIGVSSEDLKNEAKYCNNVDETRPNFRGEMVKCEKEDVITVEKRATLLKTIIPEAIKLHADRLLVKPLPGPVEVSVPSHSVCTHFTVPEKHKTDGVNLVDFVLYVAAGPGATFTAICSEESIEKRPFSAVMNFEPARILRTRHAVRIAAHEIAHALGFSYKRMEKKHQMIDSQFVSRSPPSKKPRSRQQVKPTMNRIKQQVKSTMTKNVAQKHYNCDKITGMYLEEENGKVPMISHWERRDAKDELMSVYFDLPGAMLYTAFTMAAFHDMKYFRARWENEETMTWGKDAGCEFQRSMCVEKNNSRFPRMFCNSTSETLRCTSDRFALGSCSLKTYESDVSWDYFYFEDTKLSGSEDTLTDRCPIIAPTAETVCTNGVESDMPGSRVGETSRCLNGDGIVMKDAEHVVGDVCANVKCVGDEVYVQYKGDEKWYPCPANGSLALGGKSVFSSGSIVCPPKEEVCTGLIGAVLPEYKEGNEEKEGGNDATAATADALPVTLNNDRNTASGGSSGKNKKTDGNRGSSSSKHQKDSRGTSSNSGARGRNNGISNPSEVSTSTTTNNGGKENNNGTPNFSEVSTSTTTNNGGKESNNGIPNPSEGSISTTTNNGAGGNNIESGININVVNANIDVSVVTPLLWTSLACVVAMASVLLVP